MATPGIEIRWGSGFEKQKQREAVRQNLKAAIAMALEGLIELGLPLDNNKRMVVHRVKKVGPQGDYYGSATTKNTMHLHIPSEVKWRTQKMCTLMDACGIVHELVHCQRMGVTPNDSLYERAATEGLAYNAEYAFRANKAPWYRLNGVVNKIAALDSESLTNIRYPFMAIGAQEQAQSRQAPIGVYDEWVEATHLFAVGKAEIVGIDMVTKRLRGGEELGRLIRLPATELLEAA